MRPSSIFTLSLAITLMTLHGSSADTVNLKDGRSLKGEILEKKDHIILKLKYGTIKIERKDIVSIKRDEKLPDPKTKPTPIQKKPQAPLPLPKQNRMISLRKIAGEQGFLLENPHFIIASSGKKVMAKKLQDVIQKTYNRFFEEFEKATIPLQKPKFKLEIILFPSQATFRAFKLEDHPSMIRNDGFFSRNDNRSYFYNVLDSKASRKAAVLRRPVEKDIESLEQRLLIANSLKAVSLRKRIRSLKAKLERFKKRQQRVLENICLTTAAHEVTHQLCCNTKLIPITKGFPTWLLEGIALIFEQIPQSSKRKAGEDLGALNPFRLQLLKSARQEKKKLTPLPRLISHSGSLLDLPGQLPYGTTWVLMHHLLIRHKDQYKARFFTFLKSMNELCQQRQRKKRPISEKERSHLFSVTFQISLESFDKEFQETLKSLLGN